MNPNTTDHGVLRLAEKESALTFLAAQRVCHAHGVLIGDALDELGDSATDAGALLTWLGY